MFFGVARHNGRSHDAAVEHDLPLQGTPAARSSTDAASPISKGAGDRRFRAFKKNTGKLLWQARLDDAASSAPITFAANGVQYVAVTTGRGNPNDVTRQPMAPLVSGSLSLTELEAVPPRT
jgi:glucose dehydrogenase